MLNSKSNSQVAAAVKAVKTPEPGIEIKSFALAGDGIARVVVDITHTTESRADHKLVSKALRGKLKNHMEAVAGSFTSVEHGAYTERITGLISAVREIKAIGSPADMKGFRATAANMFMDEEKDMWVLKKTEAGQVMVKTTGIEDDETLLNLLEGVASAGYRSAPEYRGLVAMASGVTNGIQGGDFVSFVDMNNITREGFIVATAASDGDNDEDTEEVLVLQPDATEAETIAPSAITEIHDTAEFPEAEFTDEEKVNQAVAVSRGTAGVEQLIAYYKKIYSMNPKFFAEFEKRIRSYNFM